MSSLVTRVAANKGLFGARSTTIKWCTKECLSANMNYRGVSFLLPLIKADALKSWEFELQVTFRKHTATC